jgi:hypothetical protein
MFVWLLALAVQADAAQAAGPCRAHLEIERPRPGAETLDLRGLAARLERDQTRGCPDLEVAMLYLRGLVAAQDAYGAGGSAESLAPVRAASARLAAIAAGSGGPAEVAGLVLQAAAAAAQSEREEMAVYLEQALRLEVLARAQGRAGAPVITAHEAAGDLWLRVHRFDEARAAYALAAEQMGVTPRIMLGRARLADRAKQTREACAAYRAVADLGTGERRGPAGQPEMAEAAAYLARAECRRLARRR